MARLWMALPLLLGLFGPALAQQTQTRDHSVTVSSPRCPPSGGKKSKLYLRERALPAVLRAAPATRWCCSSTAPAHPRKSASTCPTGLQLDGLSGEGRVRRVLGGPDRLWPLGASGADERPMQSVGRTAEDVQGRVCPGVSRCADQHRIGLERYFRSGGLHRKLRVSRGNLIGWSQGGPRAGGWAALTSRARGQARAAGAGLHRGAEAEAPGAAGAGRGVQHPEPRGVHRELGPPGAVRGTSMIRRPPHRSGRRC